MRDEFHLSSWCPRPVDSSGEFHVLIVQKDRERGQREISSRASNKTHSPIFLSRDLTNKHVTCPPQGESQDKNETRRKEASILHLPPFSKIHIPNTPADTLLHSNLFEHILTCTLHIATSAFKEIFDFPRICLNILACTLPTLQLKRYLTFLKPNGYYYKI